MGETKKGSEKGSEPFFRPAPPTVADSPGQCLFKLTFEPLRSGGQTLASTATKQLHLLVPQAFANQLSVTPSPLFRMGTQSQPRSVWEDQIG